ncbi:MAG: fumarylacetoacetate hydrolase family protein [Alphaproteobacteria bacterium]
MRLVTFVDSKGRRLGLHDPVKNEIIDLTTAAPGLPDTMERFIATGRPALEAAKGAFASGIGRIVARTVKIVAPLAEGRATVFCIGKNYRDHVKELHGKGFEKSAPAEPPPDVPIVFSKVGSSIVGPGDAIDSRLDPTATVDYEGELAVVIGAGGRGIARAQAMSHVYGYTIVNDVTSRALQQRHKQWLLGKSLDTFCPMGPCILTADEVPDVTRLRVVTRVNGEERQNGTLAELIFDIPTLIETISQTMSLRPGDLISTGTPAGVGFGFDPPKFLKAGDRVSVTIEPIGTLESPVI